MKSSLRRFIKKNPRRILGVATVVGVCVAVAAGGVTVATKSSPIVERGLSVSILPPPVLAEPPLILLSPSGQHGDVGTTQDIVDGSVLEIRAEASEDQPPLIEIAGKPLALDRKSDGAHEAKQTLDRKNYADTIDIVASGKRHKLGAWRLRLRADEPPRITFSDLPKMTARRTLRFAFEAKDDHGVARIAARARLLGVPDAPWYEVPLVSPNKAQVGQTVFADMTYLPVAGKKVELQLVARDASGNESHSDTHTLEMPTRVFKKPLAVALVDERHKLLMNATNENIRAETANLLAGMARQTNIYGRDITILLGLRTSAVRLVFARDEKDVDSVALLLWKLATRIEDSDPPPTRQVSN